MPFNQLFFYLTLNQQEKTFNLKMFNVFKKDIFLNKLLFFLMFQSINLIKKVNDFIRFKSLYQLKHKNNNKKNKKRLILTILKVFLEDI